MNSLFELTFNEITNNRVPSKTNELINVLINESELYSPNWHALGFVHCKLATFSNGTLRLHIWPSQERHVQEQQYKIHDHIFSLTSYVVCGSIKNEIYKVELASKKLASTQCYEIEYVKDGAKLRATGNYYNEIKLSDSLINSGQHYTVVSGYLHQSSVPKSTLVVTLVATYDHKTAYPRLLGPVDDSEINFREQIHYDRSKWIELLETAKNNLYKFNSLGNEI